MRNLTLELVIQLLNLVGTLLISLEIIFGTAKLVNFFSNKISHGSNEYIKGISRIILQKGIIGEKLIAKIGLALRIFAILGSICSIIRG